METERDIFDPRHYDRVRLPPDRAETLPAWCFTSPEFYAREVERIFRRAWNCVGREDVVKKAGDYYAFDFTGVPVVIIRGEDGGLCAFANTCRHRGTKLLEGEGNVRAIACPYHGWTYRLDGRLSYAPDMERTQGFRESEFGLVPIRLATRLGFLFVSFDDGGPDIDSYLGDFPKLFQPWNLADMACAVRRTYDARFNWKFHLEAFVEYYHARVVHRNSLYLRRHTPNPPDRVSGEYLTISSTHEGSSAVLKGDDARIFPPIEGLPPELHGTTRFTILYPAFIFGVTNDSMWYIQHHPMAADRCRIVFGGCFPKKVTERPDYDEIAAKYTRRWNKAFEEDNDVFLRLQAGMSSPYCAPGRLSHLESLVGSIGRWVVDRVIDGANR